MAVNAGIVKFALGTALRWHGRSARGVRRAALCALTLTLVNVLGALTACGPRTSVVATPMSTPRLTPTATMPPTTLYQADWSRGAEDWTLPAHWQVSGGQLVDDGNAADPVPIPFPITSPSYAIEMDIRVESAAVPMTCSNMFGIQSVATDGSELYHATIECITSPAVSRDTTAPPNFTIAASQLTAYDTSDYVTRDFTVTATPRTYRVVVQGRRVAFYPGGLTMGSVTAGGPLVPGRVEIVAQQVRLAITRLVITTA